MAQYTEAKKRRVVAYLSDGNTIKDTAEKYGISKATVSNWKQSAKLNGNGHTNGHDSELTTLQTRVTELEKKNQKLTFWVAKKVIEEITAS